MTFCILCIALRDLDEVIAQNNAVPQGFRARCSPRTCAELRTSCQPQGAIVASPTSTSGRRAQKLEARLEGRKIQVVAERPDLMLGRPICVDRQIPSTGGQHCPSLKGLSLPSERLKWVAGRLPATQSHDASGVRLI